MRSIFIRFLFVFFMVNWTYRRVQQDTLGMGPCKLLANESHDRGGVRRLAQP